MDELPLVLLGIRTSWREDPGCSPADLVYGTALHLPGEMIESSTARDSQPTSQFLHDLQETMRKSRPPAANFHGNNQKYQPENLSSTGYVYIRRDSHRGPLQPPYTGPFRILEVKDKCFVLDINGRRDTVSVDRLKVAHGQFSDNITQHSDY